MLGGTDRTFVGRATEIAGERALSHLQAAERDVDAVEADALASPTGADRGRGRPSR